MTTPTRQEIIEAYKTLEYLIKNLYDIPLEEAKQTTSYERLAKFLPPKPQPTMAEIEWDDDEHYLAEAEHADGYTVIMLGAESGVVQSFHYEEVDRARYSAPEDLTPTGKRYTLTEVQDD